MGWEVADWCYALAAAFGYGAVVALVQIAWLPESAAPTSLLIAAVFLAVAVVVFFTGRRLDR